MSSRGAAASASPGPRAPPGGPLSGSPSQQKLRVTVIGARSLAKRDLFRLPDPFVRISVHPAGDESGLGVDQRPWAAGSSCLGQTHCTETARNTVDPR